MLNAKAFAVFRAVFWLSAKAREKGTHLAPRPISPGHTRIRLNGHLTSWCTGHQTQPLSNSGTVLLDMNWHKPVTSTACAATRAHRRQHGLLALYIHTALAATATGPDLQEHTALAATTNWVDLKEHTALAATTNWVALISGCSSSTFEHTGSLVTLSRSSLSFWQQPLRQSRSSHRKSEQAEFYSPLLLFDKTQPLRAICRR